MSFIVFCLALTVIFLFSSSFFPNSFLNDFQLLAEINYLQMGKMVTSILYLLFVNSHKKYMIAIKDTNNYNKKT